MDGGIFDNPLDGMDLGELSFGNPTIPVEGEGKTGEGEITNTEDGEGTGEEPTLEPLDDTRATDLHQGREIPMEDEDGPEGGEEEEEVNFFSAFAEEGIIALEEEEEIPEDADLGWFAEKAKAKLQADVDSAIEDYKEGLPEEVRYLLDNYESGVSIQDLLKADKQVMDIQAITDEQLADSESLQKDLLAKYLTIAGESPEDIKETLLDYEDSGLLGKMSKKAHSKLVQYEAAQRKQMMEQKKQAEIDRQNEYKDWLSNLKTTIDSKEEILPGVKLTDKQKKELYKGITQVDKSGKNQVMKYREKNPDFDLQVAYLATVLKGDFSILENIATTKATQKVKEQANGLNSTASKSGRKLKGVDLSIMKKALNLK